MADVSYMSNANLYFQDIQAIASDTTTSTETAYKELYRILNIVLKECTSNCGMEFSGPFPRLVFLYHKYHISETDYIRLNTFRCRCRYLNETDVSSLADERPYDTKVLAEFIAKLYFVHVPDGLAKLLPVSFHPYNKQEAPTTYGKLRVCVDKWDEQYIYAHVENHELGDIKIDYNSDNIGIGERDYLIKLLKKSSQLNLIRPVLEDDVLKPQLIIYEPDYLIDVTSIAGCFENYGHSPLNYLIKKISPSPNSSAILLGNLASRFLDELINDRNMPTYKECVRHFFHDNALELASCPDIKSTFHDDARRQFDNLAHMLEYQFREIEDLRRDEIILEPSFLCETLGIQARIDLLQQDMHVLMEQKSGKRAFTGGHIESHYIQMLLYLALIHYGYGLHNDNISCFLLYSKYADGLIKEGSAPRLLFEALKLRNRIVCCELTFGERPVDKLFEHLTPEAVNEKQVNNTLWARYQQPKLQALLAPMHQSPQIEKAYFFRFYRFIQKEQILSKIGTSSKDADGFAATWNANLDEKQQTGNIFCNLQIIDKKRKDDNSGFSLITLSLPEQCYDFLPNFRTGDIVILYPYNEKEEPNALKTMVLRGSIDRISPNEICVKLRAPQSNERAFATTDRQRWAIEHDYMESSFNGLYQSLYSLFTANTDRRDWILNRKQPRYHSNAKLIGDYGEFNEMVLKAKSADDYFLLIGPPGTGKTSFGLISILQEAMAEGKESASPNNILLSAYTNRAVDEICSKLDKHHIDYIRIGMEQSCDKAYHSHLFKRLTRNCDNVSDIQALIADAHIIVGTVTTLTTHSRLFTLKHFNLAIIDEASQILEPQMMGLLCAKHGEANAIDKFVFIGDYKQLPAVVLQTEEESRVDNSDLHSIGLTNCRKSLFERLISIQHSDEHCQYMLCKQGRMHPEISVFVNKAFYNLKLRPVPVEHQNKPLSFARHDADSPAQHLLANNRVAFIATKNEGRNLSIKVNASEAHIIASIAYGAWQLYIMNGKPFIPERTLGIIVPYRNQIAMIRKELSILKIDDLLKITIDTVERFQGSERDIIIYGFTVNRLYQLDFLTNNTIIENNQLIDKKLNVVLTRAREQTILVGDPEILSHNTLFKSLIDYMKREQSYFD